MTIVLDSTTSQSGGANGVDAAALGALLLDLYRFARELTLADFQLRVLERLNEVLPFDAAWWGMTAPNRELHSSYPYKMPQRFVEYWHEIREHDILAAEVERCATRASRSCSAPGTSSRTHISQRSSRSSACVKPCARSC